VTRSSSSSGSTLYSSFHFEIPQREVDDGLDNVAQEFWALGENPMVLDRDESAAAARMLQSLVLIMFLQDARAGTARAWPLQAASTESTLDRGTAQRAETSQQAAGRLGPRRSNKEFLRVSVAKPRSRPPEEPNRCRQGRR